jgi:hypothetical protein
LLPSQAIWLPPNRHLLALVGRHKALATSVSINSGAGTNCPAPPPAISTGTVLADQLLRAWIQDRSDRRKGKGLKIGEGRPATLAAIAATGLLQITMAWLKSPQNWLIDRSLEQLSSTPNP